MRAGEQAELFLNDTCVGIVCFQRSEDSWSHGNFEPNAEFGKFAPVFGRWSLLMHADGEFEHLSPAAGEELRAAEQQIDRLAAKLHFADSDEWVKCAVINIDGPLVEWKAY